MSTVIHGEQGELVDHIVPTPLEPTRVILYAG